MPFLRQARDKRGYETTFVMHAFRPAAGQSTGKTRVLYMFRTPSHRGVGRNLLEPEVMEALQHTHPDLTFDWTAMLRAPQAAPGGDERDRHRRGDRGDRPERHDRHNRSDRQDRRERGDRHQRADRQEGGGRSDHRHDAQQDTPAAIIEDDSLAGRTLGAAEAQRLRVAYAELAQRINRRARTPEDRDRLTERAARLNPDDWADASAVSEGAARFAEELDAIRLELPRRRRGRRGGRARDREPGGSAIIENNDDAVNELETAGGADGAGLDGGLGAGDDAAGRAGADGHADEIHELD